MTSSAFQAIVDATPEGFATGLHNYKEVRERMAPLHNHPVQPGILVSRKDFAGINCGVYQREQPHDDKHWALHIHGGGLVSCPLDVYDFYGGIISANTKLNVATPDYRLAPENPYPAAIEDCLNAYRGMLDCGIPSSSITIIGESCGAALALSALRMALNERLPMPLCFVSLTGWFDLDVQEDPPGRDPFVSADWVRNRARDFVGGAVALNDPRVSPCNASMDSMPPLYLQVGQYDTMAPGALTVARNATLAGIEVTMESWPGMIQGWHGLVGSEVPEAIAAWQGIHDYIHAKLKQD